MLGFTLRNDLAELERIRPEIEAFCANEALSAQAVYVIELALEEIVTNIVKYAYTDGHAHTFAVRLIPESDQIVLRFEDDGAPFDPTGHEARPDAPLAEREIGGLGIHLVRSLARAVTYERAGDRNRLEVRVAR